MKQYRRIPGRMLAALALALSSLLIPGTAKAGAILDVTLDVTDLRGNTYGAGEPYSVDFLMTGGQGNNDSVTISNCAVTAAALGSSSSSGDFSGSLSSSLTVGDTAFVNDYNQVITPDMTLNNVAITFQMDATTNFASGFIPDNFAFSILDKNGTPIPTTDTFAGTLLNFNLTPGLGASQVAVFETTGSASVIGPPIVVAGGVVPEPASIASLALGLAGVGAVLLRKSRAAGRK